VREQTRYSVSGALSLLAHALFVLAFVWAFRVETDELRFNDDEQDFDLDFIEFDVKQIEPDKAQGEVDDKPPEPEPPAEQEAAPPPIEQPKDPDGEAALPEPEPEAPPKPKFGATSSKIKALVPPNATWTLVLANSRIKKLPFRDAATELMAPLKDFRLLVDDAGFNIWEDFEYVVMGSPDATDQTQAFVAVQYSFGHAEMKAGIERACSKNGLLVEWREENGATIGDPRHSDPDLEQKYPDDRQFVLLPGNKIALYLREAFVAQAVAGPDASKGNTSGNFVANIAKIRRYVQAEPKAGIQLVVEDIRSMVRLPKGAPIEVPSRAELMWEADKNPEIVIKLDFLEVAHADKAETYWNEKLKAELKKVPALDFLVAGIIAATTLERDQRQLVLRHQFNERMAEIVLEAAADMFGQAMRWSKKDALAAKAERERLWALREAGGLLPSQVVEQVAEPETGEPVDPLQPGEETGEPGEPGDLTPAPSEPVPSEPAPSEPSEPPSG
jgi:outer membrane biosynthesis protein TonB